MATVMNTPARYSIGLLLAVVMTFFLLWGMQALISGGNNALTEAPRGNVLDFIRLKKEQQLTKKRTQTTKTTSA
jgi:protein TonB